MPQKSNSTERFWKELKRRKVFGVFTTYAATAYIIIEVTNNIVSPLHLPGWIPAIVIMLLVAGIPVAIILSWIFDITPKGIKKTESLEELEEKAIPEEPVKRRLRPSHVLNIVLIVVVIFLAYREIFKPDPLARLRSSGGKTSIAVMPFQNMTGDTTWNIWQEGIQQSLISYLTNTGELNVKQREAVASQLQSQDQAFGPFVSLAEAGLISKNLNADIFIMGNIQKRDSVLRINARLIDTRTDNVLKSIEINGPNSVDKILVTSDSLRKKVADFMKISNLMRVDPIYNFAANETTSPEAYRCWIIASNFFHKKADFNTAITWYLKAVAIDSNFFDAGYFLILAYRINGNTEESLRWLAKLRNKDQSNPWLNFEYANYFESPAEQLKILKQIREIEGDENSGAYLIGLRYKWLGEYDNAITEFKKVVKLVQLNGGKDNWIYASLGEVYHLAGQYKNEKKIYKQAEKSYQDHTSESFSWIVKDEAILALTEKDTVAAKRYIKQYISIARENAWSDTDITLAVAKVYSEGGFFDQAENQYRKALSIEPGNPDLVNNLASFMIDKNRNIGEAMNLIDKALKFSKDKEPWSFVCTKASGLYREGKYQEALETWEKARDLLNQQCDLRFYDNKQTDQDIYSKIEMAKNAMVSKTKS